MKTTCLKFFAGILFSLLLSSSYSQTCDTSYLCNGGFESTYYTTSVTQVTALTCWNSLASDGKMEVWGTNFNSVPAYNGNQFVELNANEPGTMYQDFNVNTGVNLSVSFAHRGRAGVDTVEVSIGPSGGPYTVLGRFGDGTSAWGYYTNNYTTSSTGSYRVLFTPVYWSGGNIAIGNFLDSVSVIGSNTGVASVVGSPLVYCAGGSSTLTATGVTSSTWSTGSNSNTLVVSPPATTSYTWQGLSIGGCTAQAVITVTVNNPPIIAVTSPSPSICPSVGVNLTVSGATTYTWQPGNLNGATIPISPGATVVYSVTGTYTNGCPGSTTYTETVNAAPMLTLSANMQVICSGSAYTISAGGAATYSWQPGNITGPTYTAIASSPAVFTVTGTSVAGCTATATSSVFVLPLPVLTVVPYSITCASLGSATVSAMGGVGAFSYTWTPSAQTGSFANSLSPGTYTISVFDVGTGCTSDTTVTFTSLIPLTGNLNATQSLVCNGVNTGTAGYTNLAGGSPIQNYFWTNGISTFAIPSPTTLGAGAWSVTVTDALTGCTIKNTFTITQPPALSLTATGATVCTSQSFSLFATSQPGGLNYTWSGPLGFSSGQQNPYIFNPSLNVTGAYTVIAKDLTNCTVSALALVKIVSPPSPSLSSSGSSLCAQGFNGSPNTITLTASGANTYTLITPGSFLNSNPGGPVFPLLSNAAANAGPITVTLQASNGVCASTATDLFYVIPNPAITINPPGAAICFGESYSFTAQGADSYTWAPAGSYLTTYNNGQLAIVNPAFSTLYSVYGISLGCNSTSQTSNLIVNPLPTLSLAASTAIICLTGNAVLTTLGTGTSFMWQPSTGLSSNTGATVSASPPATQTYTVIASLNSCTNIATATVAVLPLPVPTASISQQTLCFNDPLILQGFGGQTYLWSGAGGQFYQGQTVNLLVNNLSMAGAYVLTVTDGNGCSASTTAGPVVINDVPNLILPLTAREGCIPFCSSFTLNPYVSIGTSWSLGGITFQGNAFTYCFDKAGDYLLKASLKDPNTGCAVTSTVDIKALPKPVANFNYFPENPIEGIDPVNFNNSSKGQSLDQWDWYFIANGNYHTKQENPTFIFPNPGIYPVALIISNQWGCADTVVRNINVLPDYALYIPNAFTPNGDGLNDTFQALGNGLKQYSLLVFDRWGEQLFSSDTIQKGWDGTFKGEPCKIDVYTWKIKVSFSNNATKDLAGSVTLYR